MLPRKITDIGEARTIGRYPKSRLLFAAFLAGLVSQSFGAFVGFQHIPRVGKTILSSLEASPLSSEEVRARLVAQLEKLRHKDREAKVLSKKVRLVVGVYYHPGCRTTDLFPSFVNHETITRKDLVIVSEDEFLVVVDKPSGVLSVASEQGIPSLAQAVFENTISNFSSYDRMVVHRLGTETSGLIVFAKTMEALRGMNSLFRTRRVLRQYEVLVCGHVKDQSGTIDMPLMRDYVHPPFMRVSTDEHQKSLLDLNPSVVGKKLLEAPKPSQTRYEVVSRETLKDTELPVTRLTVTSITGRTHQLNVHCAAFGHPIVGDRVYGLDGDAASYGGLEPPPDRDGTATIELQTEIAKAAREMKMCVHAKLLKFQHPITNKPLEFKSPAPF